MITFSLSSTRVSNHTLWTLDSYNPLFPSDHVHSLQGVYRLLILITPHNYPVLETLKSGY